jgi:DNA-directed RNA polymerase specialized sigma24 family protein
MSIMTEQVWEAFHVPLYQFIRKRVNDEAVAEDLLQFSRVGVLSLSKKTLLAYHQCI